MHAQSVFDSHRILISDFCARGHPLTAAAFAGGAFADIACVRYCDACVCMYMHMSRIIDGTTLTDLLR